MKRLVGSMAMAAGALLMVTTVVVATPPAGAQRADVLAADQLFGALASGPRPEVDKAVQGFPDHVLRAETAQLAARDGDWRVYVASARGPGEACLLAVRDSGGDGEIREFATCDNTRRIAARGGIVGLAGSAEKYTLFLAVTDAVNEARANTVDSNGDTHLVLPRTEMDAGARGLVLEIEGRGELEVTTVTDGAETQFAVPMPWNDEDAEVIVGGQGR